MREYTEAIRKSNRESMQALRVERKQALIDAHASGPGCDYCGWNAHQAGLQFHHRSPADKEFIISTGIRDGVKKYPMEKLLKEAAKCILICANCHALMHAGVIEIEDAHRGPVHPNVRGNWNA